MTEKTLIMAIFLGPAILGVLTLLLGLLSARSDEGLFGWGLVAGGFFALQFVIIGGLKAWGEAWSGSQGGSPIFFYLAVGCIVSLIVYGIVGRNKIRKNPPK